MTSIICKLRAYRTVRKFVLSSCEKFHNVFRMQVKRIHSMPPSLSNYEGDGKTIATILNREHRHRIMFDSYSNYGFRLNNGVFVFGPMAVFPKSVLQWSVQTVEEITPETLSLFCILEPKIDILVIGTGDKGESISREASKFLKSKNISVEILATDKACSTFNFLNAENRCVAGGLIPPSKVVKYTIDMNFIGDDSRLEALIPPLSDFKIKQ